jgi:hypothetical protein
MLLIMYMLSHVYTVCCFNYQSEGLYGAPDEPECAVIVGSSSSSTQRCDHVLYYGYVQCMVCGDVGEF